MKYNRRRDKIRFFCLVKDYLQERFHIKDLSLPIILLLVTVLIGSMVLVLVATERVQWQAVIDLFKKIQELAINCVWVHCNSHRQALAVKRIPSKFKHDPGRMCQVCKLHKISFIKKQTFTKLYKEMGSGHKQFFSHCNSRWLSNRNVLKRMFELKDENLVFQNEHPLFKKDPIFI